MHPEQQSATLRYDFKLPLSFWYVNADIRKFRLTCELRNLLNRKSYSYTIFMGLDRFTYDYRLRGRELILSVDFKM